MENKRTCLYDRHVALGALISPFGGFDMPIQYSSIIEEHNAVRQPSTAVCSTCRTWARYASRVPTPSAM